MKEQQLIRLPSPHKKTNLTSERPSNEPQKIAKQQLIQRIICSEYAKSINQHVSAKDLNNVKNHKLPTFPFSPRAFHRDNQPHSSDNEIDMLQVSDYIKLTAHQMKALTPQKLKRLSTLNQNQKLQQQDFKYYLMVLSEAHYLKLSNPNYYRTILTQRQNYPELYFTPILKDIPRTLANQNPFQKPLEQILVGYAIRNPTLLYCQGMNYLASYLLMNGFTEEQAFWFLTILIEQILPGDFFKDLGTISVSSLVFNDLLQQMFPEFWQSLQHVGMDTSMFLVSWFVCLFTKGFINSVSHYMLAQLLINARKYKEVGYVLVCIALGIIFAVEERDMKRLHSIANTIHNRQNGYLSTDKSFVDPRIFKQNFQTSVFEVSLNDIRQGIANIRLDYQDFMVLYTFYKEKREERVKNIIAKEIKENQKWIQARKLQSLNNNNNQLLTKQPVPRNLTRFSLPACKQQYPVCLQRIEIQKKLGQVEEVHILTHGYPLEQSYIEDYFTHTDSQREFKISQKEITRNHSDMNQNFADCLFYRRPHICSGTNRQTRIDKTLLKRGLSLKQDVHQKQKFNQLTLKQGVQQLDESEHEHSHHFRAQRNRLRKKIWPSKQQKTEEKEEQRQLEYEYQVSQEMASSFSKVEQKFTELSEYFVVDPEFLSKQEIQFENEQQLQSQINQDKLFVSRKEQQMMKYPGHNRQSKIALVGIALKKVINSLNVLKKNE